jgi:hypothetical protein
MNFLVKNPILRANNDSNNWSDNNIGISTTIGSIDNLPKKSTSIPKYINFPDLIDINNEDGDVTNNIGNIKTQGTKIAESTGKIDRRYGKDINGMSPAGSVNMARGIIALNIAIKSFEGGVFLARKYEEYKISKHLEFLENAIGNVNMELNSKNSLIPEEYRNESDLSNIINTVLQGENSSDNKNLYDIGIKIYNKYNEKKDEKD